MSNLGNKDIMAKNIKRLMGEAGVDPVDVCTVLHFPLSTFSGWINAKSYPRIDKVEMLANYFGVSKSDLVEDYQTIKKNNDALADIIIRAQRNEKFLDVLQSLFAIPDNRLDMAKAVIDALNQ